MGISGKELAKLLNISEAAISMALNNKPGVSTKTRNIIITAAKEHGYNFSKMEEKKIQPLPSGHISFIIIKKRGIIVDDSSFFSHLFEGINSGCSEHHYALNTSYIYENDDLERQVHDTISFGCKGLILLGTEMNENSYKYFDKLGIPIVVLDTYFRNISTNYVVIDNVQGSYLATDYLISKCNSQPGYLKSSYTISNFLERADGFYDAIRQNGMATSKSVVHVLSPSIEGAYADMVELLKNGEVPAKCYFADNDSIAFGAMKALKDFGYNIPSDISIVGFDNTPYYNQIDPSLTTIDVPKSYFGTTAARRLIELIKRPDTSPIKILISTSLIVRKSVTK